MQLASLESLRDRHRDEDVIVCGCGRSLLDFAESGRYTTIGVNDVGRRFVPDYLVVVNPPESFSAERWAHVRATNPPVFLSQYRLDVRARTYVQFQLGRYGGTRFDEPGVLHYTQNSPYVALCLAVHLGARRIGLFGVDFTDDHFFGPTGRHPLSRRLAEIDEQFHGLDRACRARGIEILNLSAESRLTAFRKARIEDLRPRDQRAAPSDVRPLSRPVAPPRIFFVNYTFQTAGDVLRDGLVHAAGELRVPHAIAQWDDPGLAATVERFAPDLLFVIHGRGFARGWGRAFARYRTAVWLVDEPYEVDDTSRYSGLFDHVFVNDRASLGRHPRSAYLPLAYDPVHCNDPGGERLWGAGFVGGANNAREALLDPLARAEVLSYVVGGPWRSPALVRRCRATHVTPAEAAALYRQTQVVINIFRDRHHWNRHGLAAASLNPRIYEAVASGALVVSEPRGELAELVPELPVFAGREHLVSLVRHYLHHPAERDAVSAACRRRLAGHTFAERLKRVIAMTLEPSFGAASAPGPAEPGLPAQLLGFSLPADVSTPAAASDADPLAAAVDDRSETAALNAAARVGPEPLPPSDDEAIDAAAVAPTLDGILEEWVDHGGVVGVDRDGLIALRKPPDGSPGSELGLASRERYRAVELAFEVWIDEASCFIAKIHQGDRLDQMTNSYHLMSAPPSSYLARHHHVFTQVPIGANRWHRVRLTYRGGLLECHLDGHAVFRGAQTLLEEGYAFLGVKGGAAWLRHIRLREPGMGALDGAPLRVVREFSSAFEPRVSIVTTVYDRVECLRRCLRSVRALRYADWEHVVVADAPPADTLAALARVVAEEDGGRVMLATTARRFNNWGIGPAAAGLRQTRGRYVCFLSDDNGYTSDHFEPLVTALDSEATVGFAYSSCRYDGRFILSHPVPRPGGIDLGQPLFRRELFTRYLGNGLPFDMAAWDWHMIEALVRRGVRWRHVDQPSFIFRLAKYPRLIAGAP